MQDRQTMSTDEFIESLMSLVTEREDVDDTFLGAQTSTYAEAGMLTLNDGLVIRVGGDEFRLTVHRAPR